MSRLEAFCAPLQVGFFRRKKKPGEDEEVEGDFNAPAETEVKAAAEPPTKGEGTTV